MCGRERTARCRRCYPYRRAELFGQANRMSIGTTRVDLRPEHKDGIFGSVQTAVDARQRRPIELANRLTLAADRALCLLFPLRIPVPIGHRWITRSPRRPPLPR